LTQSLLVYVINADSPAYNHSGQVQNRTKNYETTV